MVHLLYHKRQLDDVFFDDKITGSYALYANKIKAVAAMLLKIICGNLCIGRKFYIDRYFIDEDNWCEGFIIFSHDGYTE